MLKRLCFFCCVAIFFACSSTHEMPDVSVNYNWGVSYFTPRYALYAGNDSIARLFFQLDLHRLASLKKDSNTVFPLQLGVKRFDVTTFDLRDSVLRRINLQADSAYSKFSNYISIYTKQESASALEVSCRLAPLDINDSRWLLLDSSYLHNQIYYCLVHNSQFWFEPYLNQLQKYELKSDKYPNFKGVSFCDTVFEPAELPYAEDNTIIIPIKPQQFDSAASFIPQKGLVQFFKADSSLIFSQYCGDTIFPQLISPQDMLNPLVYIEKNVALHRTSKITLDAFWFTAAGKDAERARELIRVFYNRVQLANQLFTSYKEGWKTDRGMIFIVLGLPTSISLEESGERWTYENEDKKSPLTFVFHRAYRYMNANDYRLLRSPIYRSVWKDAQESWSKGKVFIY